MRVGLLIRNIDHRIMGNQGDRGMAALVVTTVLIAVVGLIIIGFSLTVRRNQRETLDQQLSTQAYYAAESGVNYARKIASSAIATSSAVPSQTTCTGSNYVPPILDTGSNTEVTCLMVSSSLPSQTYNTISQNRPTIIPVIASNAVDIINTITLTWTPTTGSAVGCNGAGGTLPTRANWSCGYGLLRADITNDFSGTNFAYSAFFVPNNGGGSSVNFTPANPSGNIGAKVSASCNGTRCQASITGLSARTYYMRVNSIYHDIPTLIVTATNSSGTQLNLSGQVQIDSTGKSRDVLRRIQVRVPTIDSNDVPMYAAQSTNDICKRFTVAPNYYSGPCLP